MKTIFLLFFVFIFCIATAQDTIYEKKITAIVQKAYQYAYTNKDSAYFYLDKAFLIANKNKDWESILTILSASNRSASYFYDLERMNNTLIQSDSVFKNYKAEINTSKNKLLITNYLCFDKGIYYNELGDYKKARKNFQNIIKNVERLPDSSLNSYHIELLLTSYQYAANMYSFENKLDLAKQYFFKIIQYISKKNTGDKKILHSTYILLAEVYKKEKQYQISNNYYKKSIKYNIEASGNRNSILAISFNLAKNYADLKQKDSATYYLDLAKTYLSENHAFWYKYYNTQAYLYNKNNNYSLALQTNLKFLELIKLKWKNKYNVAVANAYNTLGEFEIENKHQKKALHFFNKATLYMTENKQSSSALNNTSLLVTLKNKAFILNTLKNTNNYKKTTSTVTKAISVLDSLKPTFKNKTDKLLLIENAFPIFESGLEATYYLYKEKNNAKYIDTAFYYAEKSKSVLLLEALLSTKASKFGNIPSQILEKEKQLKSQITNKEKKINRSKKQNKILEEGLFALRKEYRNLIKDIETNYPSYYNLKYNTQVISLKKTQELLNEDQKLLSYFYGNNAIYAISLTKTTKQFKQFLLDSTTNEQITNIYKKLSNPKSDVNILAKETFSIYQQMVAPMLEKNKKSNVIIIADGLLNYLPFSSFNTKEKTIHYLIEDKSIGYISSATLWSQLTNTHTTEPSLVAFAPSFNSKKNNHTGKQLLPLPNNEKEIDLISNYFEDGYFYKNKEASLSYFKKEASQFNIIHLATHAIVNDVSPEFSYLAFSLSEKEEEEGNLLYISDLYNLNLKANLITLSACDSGIGDLQRGEGFISLANGFFYSGAESVANTLWKINDASSSIIMGDFYKNLKSGKTKPLALQEAKKQFISTNSQNALSHPYYWSSFIISGNTEPLIQNKNLVWIYLGCFILLPILFLFFRKKK